MGIGLADGVDETDVAAALDVYPGMSLAARTVPISAGPTVTTRHGLTLVVAPAAASAPHMDRLIVPAPPALPGSIPASPGGRPPGHSTSSCPAADPTADSATTRCCVTSPATPTGQPRSRPRSTPNTPPPSSISPAPHGHGVPQPSSAPLCASAWAWACYPLSSADVGDGTRARAAAYRAPGVSDQRCNREGVQFRGGRVGAGTDDQPHRPRQDHRRACGTPATGDGDHSCPCGWPPPPPPARPAPITLSDRDRPAGPAQGPVLA